MPVVGTNIHIASIDDSMKMHVPQSSKVILLNFSGEHKEGELVLDIVVHICLTSLISYPGEKERLRDHLEVFELHFLCI
ncbi:hypothetical protein KSP40_PGU010651 [Platanthera guangdongensis]|uniref:Uncharacterized protein n=1 Tax=Platanthera guangdongensis TaxID=2320717 RepID=A0ABR2LLQ5_9ASPA